MATATATEAATVWAAAQPWVDHDAGAREAARRAEERLGALHPELIDRYEQHLADGFDPVDAMIDAAAVLAPSEADVIAAAAARAVAGTEQGRGAPRLHDPDLAATVDIDEHTHGIDPARPTPPYRTTLPRRPSRAARRRRISVPTSTSRRSTNSSAGLRNANLRRGLNRPTWWVLKLPGRQRQLAAEPWSELRLGRPVRPERAPPPGDSTRQPHLGSGSLSRVLAVLRSRRPPPRRWRSTNMVHFCAGAA